MVEGLKTRNMETLEGVIESGEFKCVKLRGQKPKLAYRDQQIDGIVSAVHKRFQLDDSAVSVVQASKVLCFNKWPLKDIDKLQGTSDEQETAEPDDVDSDDETQQINELFCQHDNSDYCTDYQEEGDNEKMIIKYLNSDN
ncbi:hypothetical protein DPMN_111295 [Dreissena polymorpha]|uniref:Uncharacterized protein n=1 Tax=Dreissena polymorpha TaxID=45954 RepID=A0A9D4KDM6_DREPO|nr:hypothetical protein DPMN_111295 [Dreissena polymorpha]